MKLRNVTGVFLAGLVALLLPVTVSQVRAQGQAASGAVTPSGSLVVGDAAPPITIETWLKGTPVPVLKKGETYVPPEHSAPDGAPGEVQGEERHDHRHLER
jgi:hypothetical protein